MKVKVKFIKEASGIKVGTIKNLSKATAQGCINLGVAELVKEEKAKPAPKKKAPFKKAD